jgi:hypothetical protein
MPSRSTPPQFHYAEEFFDDLEVAASKLRDKAPEFEGEFGRVMQRLEREGSKIATMHVGVLKQLFSVPVKFGYQIVFEWKTDRDGQGHPLKEHIYLLKIEKVKP